MNESNNSPEEKNEPINEKNKTEKSKISEETEKLKKETKDTVNKVKDTIKKTDFKKNANETTNFVKEMFFNPVEAVRRAANEEGILGKVIILMIVFIAATVFGTIVILFKYGKLFSFGNNLVRLALSFCRPIITVLVPSIVIYLAIKDNKRLTTVISTVVVAYIPRILNSILIIIDLLITKITLFTNPVEKVLSGLSIILTYFGFKELYGKDNDSNLIKKYAIILLISEFILMVLSEIGIY